MKPLLVLTLLCLGTQAMADDSLKDFTGVWASAPGGLAQARVVCDKYLRDEFQTKHGVLDPGYTIIGICEGKIEQLYLPIRCGVDVRQIVRRQNVVRFMEACYTKGSYGPYIDREQIRINGPDTIWLSYPKGDYVRCTRSYDCDSN
jgi:hypothetical protein